MKVGKPVARQAVKQGKGYRRIGMPAGRRSHIAQGMERLEGRRPLPESKPCIRSKSSPAPMVLPPEGQAMRLRQQAEKSRQRDITAGSRRYTAKRTRARIRADKRVRRAETNRRRVEVGPFATFHFENYETMWLQMQEMLHIEKGGERADRRTNSAPTIR